MRDGLAPTAPPQPEAGISVELTTGALSVTPTRADWPLDALCTFAARHNPKRGFLFVSKVLGKHWPATPREMRRAQAALAAMLPAPEAAAIPTPALFIGLAETATGLGQGVFEQYLQAHGPGSAIYVQTTRYPLSGATVLPFTERHSHAQHLRLHVPEQADMSSAFARAKLLVLVDDELSTGDTFLSLIAAYRALNPGLQAVAAVALTNFMGAVGQARFRAAAEGLSVGFPSLLEGGYGFAPRADFVATPAPSAQGVVDCRRAYSSTASARLGTAATLTLPPGMLDTLIPTLPRDGTVLVLGSGEFMHPAFVLGSALEAAGFSVRVQSTTRSPVLVGAGITTRVDLPDPYGEGIPNYLYNFVRADYGAVLFCHELPDAHDVALAETLARLDARGVAFNTGPAA
jgi:hypothetical protein